MGFGITVHIVNRRREIIVFTDIIFIVQSMYLSISLSICIPICPSISRSHSISLSTNQTVYLSLSFYNSIYPPQVRIHSSPSIDIFIIYFSKAHGKSFGKWRRTPSYRRRRGLMQKAAAYSCAGAASLRRILLADTSLRYM